MQEFMSLYDYLGQPGGRKLGREVYAAAKAGNEPVEERKVATQKYNGRVLLYRRSFLENYFTNINT